MQTDCRHHVDDVPFGSSTLGKGGWITPDIDPSDLARVRCTWTAGYTLRRSSLGRAAQYVTVDPSTTVSVPRSGRCQ